LLIEKNKSSIMQKELIGHNLILELSFEFSLWVNEYGGKLDERKRSIVSKQLLHSGTAIGDSCFEVQKGENKADFIPNIKVAAQEAGETQYWLMPCDHKKGYPVSTLNLQKPGEAAEVLNKILETGKRKSPLSSCLNFLIF
jgi:four helix bundle protein